MEEKKRKEYMKDYIDLFTVVFFLFFLIGGGIIVLFLLSGLIESPPYLGGICLICYFIISYTLTNFIDLTEEWGD